MCRIGAVDGKILPTKLGHPRKSIIRRDKHNRISTAKPTTVLGRGETVMLGLILAGRGPACGSGLPFGITKA